MAGVSGLEILHLEVLGLNRVLVLTILSGEKLGLFLAGFVLCNFDFHILDRNCFSLRTVKRLIRSHVPALKLHTIAGNFDESVVRSKVTSNIVRIGEVSESRPFGLRGIKVGTVRYLNRA